MLAKISERESPPLPLKYRKAAMQLGMVDTNVVRVFESVKKL